MAKTATITSDPSQVFSQMTLTKVRKDQTRKQRDQS